MKLRMSHLLDSSLHGLHLTHALLDDDFLIHVSCLPFLSASLIDVSHKDSKKR